ncbi:hypothetical protein Nmel_009181 [Mimus melanotis]
MKHVIRNTLYCNLLLSKFEGLQPHVMLLTGPAPPWQEEKNRVSITYNYVADTFLRWEGTVR